MFLSTKDRGHKTSGYDQTLIVLTSFILVVGLIMMCSASVAIAEKVHADALFYLKKQSLFLLFCLPLMFLVTRVPLVFWQKTDRLLLLLALSLLVIVLVPGIGYEVNGSQRWLRLGFVRLQVSEFAKLFFIIFLSGYLSRYRENLNTVTTGLLKPLAMLTFLAVLLMLQPDFGAMVVISLTSLGMLFLAGVKLRHWCAVLSLSIPLFLLLAITSPYRWERLTAFMNPWADQYNSGYQLTQSLIAFGRGEWFGIGLGAGIQKLFYLPEAHTDFLFAVIGEELGFAGLSVVLSLFLLLVLRAFSIGRFAQQQGQWFAAYLGYGIALWFGLQIWINMGVNIGLLPTKGLTLPLMSYGRSSLLVSLIAIGILLRIDLEHHPVTNRRKSDAR